MVRPALSLILPTLLVAPAADAAPAGRDRIADVAERRVQGVVNISTTKTQRRRHNASPYFADPFFGPGGPLGGPPQRQQRQEQSLGSGVIVAKSGIVLTNNHVVEKSDSIRVTLSDGREFEATIVGTDPKSDIAVIKMKRAPKDLVPIPFGNSDRLRLGETVVAIGNPFGLGHTVTMGIVSAKGRANVGIADYEDFIQTDAAINPGNSGGALVDLQGRLIGVNTAIASRSGGYQGIGFAVPSNMARNVMRSLIDSGRVRRGYLGVAIQDVNRSLAKALSLKAPRGVLISDVVPDSPAMRGGLVRGDVVLAIGPRRIRDAADFRNRIAAAGNGKRLRLRIARSGGEKTVQVALGELGAPGGQAAATNKTSQERSGVLAGLRLQPLDNANRRRYRIPNAVRSGLLVLGVAKGSRSASSGLRPGDVLLEVNRRPVDKLHQFKKAYTNSGSHVLLLVHRGDRTLFMVLSK
jgi:serine protease Do